VNRNVKFLNIIVISFTRDGEITSVKNALAALTTVVTSELYVNFVTNGYLPVLVKDGLFFVVREIPVVLEPDNFKDSIVSLSFLKFMILSWEGIFLMNKNG
jgi:hypothetical protein